MSSIFCYTHEKHQLKSPLIWHKTLTSFTSPLQSFSLPPFRIKMIQKRHRIQSDKFIGICIIVSQPQKRWDTALIMMMILFVLPPVQKTRTYKPIYYTENFLLVISYLLEIKCLCISSFCKLPPRSSSKRI